LLSGAKVQTPEAEDELWAELDRSMMTGHVNIQHSKERPSNRYIFFAKLKLNVKQKQKDSGQTSEVTHGALFAAYQAAEKAKKFTVAKGMTGVSRENELSQLMKWGDFLTKEGLMSQWRELEVQQDGITAFYSIQLGRTFCGLIQDEAEVAKYVLNTLVRAVDKDGGLNNADDKAWEKRVMDSTVTKMKIIVKTLALEWKWAKKMFECCRTRPITATEKMNEDFAVVATAFDATEVHRLKTDRTGKKANLHPLALELWDTIQHVIVAQKHYGTFMSAEMMNKSLENTLTLDSLQDLCKDNIMNPWKDANAQFTQKDMAEKKVDAPDDEDKETSTMTVLPTRKESIRSAAKNEFDTYTETSFVLSGNAAADRRRVLEKDLAKARTVKNATWNPDTQGNRRAMIFDPCGKSNPRWAYINGRNEFRSKVGFPKDDFEDFADTWAMIAKPEARGPGISLVHTVCSKHCI
jgi:hypothetical protein